MQSGGWFFFHDLITDICWLTPHLGFAPRADEGPEVDVFWMVGDTVKGNSCRGHKAKLSSWITLVLQEPTDMISLHSPSSLLMKRACKRVPEEVAGELLGCFPWMRWRSGHPEFLGPTGPAWSAAAPWSPDWHVHAAAGQTRAGLRLYLTRLNRLHTFLLLIPGHYFEPYSVSSTLDGDTVSFRLSF